MSFLRWVIALVVIAGGVAAIGGFKYHQIQQAQASGGWGGEPEVTVESANAAMASYLPVVNVTGEVEAWQKVNIYNEVAGKITKINFKSGDRVTQGQLLLELDHAEESARLTGAKASLNLSKLRLERVEKLKKNRQISEETVDVASADIKLAQAEVELLQSQIAKKIFKAPYSGTTGIHDLEPGQYLDSNTLITTLLGDSEFVWIDFQIPQSYPLLANGTVVQISRIGTNETWPATITAVSPELSRTRSYHYRAKLDNKGPDLKPNTLVNLAVPVAAEQSLVGVPEMSILQDQFGTYVYQLQASEQDPTVRAVRTQVVIVDRVAGTALLDSGLEEGAQVATVGAFKLWPQVKVNQAGAAEEAGDGTW